MYRSRVFTYYQSVSPFSCSVISDCKPMDCSMPSLPVHHQLPEFAQTHVHRVGDAIQPTYSVFPFSCLQSFPASGSFPMSQFFTSGGPSTGASASVLPVNIQDRFPFGWTGWNPLLSKGLQDSRVFSNHSSKASILWCSVFFIVLLSQPYMSVYLTLGLPWWLNGKEFACQTGNMCLIL